MGAGRDTGRAGECLTVSDNPVEVTEAPARLVVAVRFAPVGKLYHFDTTAHPEVRPGDRVVVETTRGRQVGEVVRFVVPPPGGAPEPEGAIKPIELMATPRELAQQQCWKSHEAEAFAKCRQRASQLDLRDIKIVRAEFSYDGTRLTFLVSTPDENGRLDVKSLREDMQAAYPEPQVSVRQIGPRDAAKLIGGIGACGLAARCCCQFLVDFNPVSIKMAKEQGISLNPEEITGMCGRLRCCMAYEFEQYSELRKTLPKRNKMVQTAKGLGKVVEVNPLKETIFVEFREGDESRVTELSRGEFEVVTALPEPEMPGKKEKGAAESRPAQAADSASAQAAENQAAQGSAQPTQGSVQPTQGGARQPARSGEGRRGRRSRGDKRGGGGKPRSQ
jgi:cell fate regulator YaaT (PSP1 superfamily)